MTYDRKYWDILTGRATPLNPESMNDFEGRIEAGLAGAGGSTTIYRPEDYGAVRNGVTDDTQAIIDCINAAVTAAQADGTNYAEVQFSAGIYQLSKALTRAAATQTNAQIPLPLIADTLPKVTLVLKGSQEASALPHWNQTDSQTSGVVLRTSLTAQTYDGTWGPPAIMAGPSIEKGYGAGYNGNFSNMMLVLDGITFMCPLDGTLDGVNAIGIAEMAFGTLNFKSVGYPAAGAGTYTLPTAGIWAGTPAPNNYFATALRMPGTGNNAIAYGRSLSVENWLCALEPCEHASIDNFRAIYCNIAVHMFQTATHAAHLKNVLIEGCRTFFYGDVQYTASGEPNAWLKVDCMDWEVFNAPFALVNWFYDPSGRVLGEVNYTPFGGVWTAQHPVIGGNVSTTTRCKIKDITAITGDPASGAIAAPAIPATTVAIYNPFHRDAACTVAGGTVTVIAVDGQATGIIAGTVLVPAGRTIALTYTVAPTWKWTVL